MLSKVAAALGAILMAVGFWMIYPAAGVIAGGVLLLNLAYVARYLEVRS